MVWLTKESASYLRRNMGKDEGCDLFAFFLLGLPWLDEREFKEGVILYDANGQISRLILGDLVILGTAILGFDLQIP
jgi:hypothetical protein